MTGIQYTNLRTILRVDLKEFPYRYETHQDIKPQDLFSRVNLANWFLLLDRFDDDFTGNIWWSDESKFALHGAVNSHNAVHWRTSPPDRVHITPPQSSPKLNVWIVFSSHGYLEPYFFRDQAGASVSVNGPRYLELLEDHFMPQL